MVAFQMVAEVRGDLPGLTAPHIVLAEIAGIGQYTFRLAQTVRQRMQSLEGRCDFPHVIGLLAEMVRHDQVRINSHRRLCIAGLHKTLRGGHDARLPVGEVGLVLVTRDLEGGLGVRPRASSRAAAPASGGA